MFPKAAHFALLFLLWVTVLGNHCIDGAIRVAAEINVEWLNEEPKQKHRFDSKCDWCDYQKRDCAVVNDHRRP